MLNNVTDVLSVVLSGTLGRSGRKKARRASNFLMGNRGFLSASTLIGAAGVAWGIYDTLKNQHHESYRESRRANELTQATAAWA